MKHYNQNNFKLSFNKNRTQFFVNEKKGTVSCIISAYLVCPYSWNSPVVIGCLEINCTGIAKCHADDTFDVERGKRIAMAKAENKAYLKAVSYLEEKQKHLVFMNDAIEAFSSKAYHQCNHNVDYMDSISNTDHPRYKKNITKVKSGCTNNTPNND